MSATELRAHARLFRGAVSVAAGVLFAAVLLGAGRFDAAPSTPGGTIRALPITAALRTAIRTSFYHAYRADPRGFSATAGLPSSAVLELGLNDAAVLAGTTPAESSAWVIGAVCMLTPVACEDAGAFQVFYRTALTNSFVYLPGGLCDLPAPLASRWFPGGHYPLGIACPAGNVLVRRSGVRPGAWAALVPRAWTRVPYGAVHFGVLQHARRSEAEPVAVQFRGWRYRHRRLVRPGQDEGAADGDHVQGRRLLPAHDGLLAPARGTARGHGLEPTRRLGARLLRAPRHGEAFTRIGRSHHPSARPIPTGT